MNYQQHSLGWDLGILCWVGDWYFPFPSHPAQYVHKLKETKLFLIFPISNYFNQITPMSMIFTVTCADFYPTTLLNYLGCHQSLWGPAVFCYHFPAAVVQWLLHMKRYQWLAGDESSILQMLLITVSSIVKQIYFKDKGLSHSYRSIKKSYEEISVFQCAL